MEIYFSTTGSTGSACIRAKKKEIWIPIYFIVNRL
jgi:hypothetical protein